MKILKQLLIDKNNIIAYKKGKYKGIKIEWLKNKEYKITFLGEEETVSHFDFSKKKGRIYCLKCGVIHFDFNNKRINKKEL